MLALLLFAALFSLSASAQESGDIIEALNKVLPNAPAGNMHYDPKTGLTIWTNVYFNVSNKNGGHTALEADYAEVNSQTGDVRADGHVRIENDGQLWVGEHIDYNLTTHRMSSEQFRSGVAPAYIGGESLNGLISKEKGATNVLITTNAFVTTDDVAEPFYRVHADRIKITVGQKVEMWNAVFYLGKVPVFYYPYYSRVLGRRVNNLIVMPGFRSRFGAELLGTYSWYLGDVADGKIHADYRSNRGPGFGPDVNLHLGPQWGEASLKYYYTHDQKPNNDTNGLPFLGNIPHNRQMFNLGWQATPATNLNLKALINYQSDPLILHDYYPGRYTQDPQPGTLFEANKYWDNWSLDALATPQINDYFAQVERLPDVQLTGFRQQVGNTPIYYDSQSSLGEYRSYAGNTTNNVFDPSLGYFSNSAARFDTYHQLTLPETFFNFLNVTPRVGGRFTHYNVDGGNLPSTQTDSSRGVLNTGVEFSFKASQLWADAKNSFFQVDGLRHIIEPSANYVFVPDPSVPPTQLPQFDSELPSLMLSPVDFPDYNSIDSIDSQNVIRFGLRNVLQTKRDGQLQDLVNWNLLLDWRLNPKAAQNGLPEQTSLNDLYSQLSFRPRTWLTFESQLRYNIDTGDLNMAFHQITFAPNNRWSWGVGDWYLRGGVWGNIVNDINNVNVGWQKSDYLTSTFFYRLDDNWGARMQHNFDFDTGRLQSQFYTLYRDMRSWTAALTFRVENNVNSSPDYTIAFQISLKANPSTHVGNDVANPYHLLGE